MKFHEISVFLVLFQERNEDQFAQKGCIQGSILIIFHVKTGLPQKKTALPSYFVSIFIKFQQGKEATFGHFHSLSVRNRSHVW